MAGHIQQQFEGLVREAYGEPGELSPLMVDALRNAFFAGVLVAYTTPEDLTGELRSYRQQLSAKVRHHKAVN